MTTQSILKSAGIAGIALMMTALTANAAGHVGAPKTIKASSGKSYLADNHDMTLYIFDKDKKNTSNCYDACATKWPPLMGKKGMNLPKGYDLIERKGGEMQIAYKGQPLYLWFKDKKPGDMSGDGVKGVWHTARP